jgi:hypothetical protein
MSDAQFAGLELAGRWDSGVLEPLAEINEEVVEVLTGASAAESAAGPVITALRWRWQALAAPARRRLAHCPYLLLDAGFARPELWAALPRAAVNDAPLVGDSAARLKPMPTPLIRRVLLLGWHLARANRFTARLALGMSTECAQLLTRCRLADLEWFAEQRPAFVRPRWEDRPELWQALMGAAAIEKSLDLERLQCWGLQKLAAEALGSGAGGCSAPVTLESRLR